MTPEPPNALAATWAKHDLAQLLTVYEDEIDRSGCFPFQEDREEWDGSAWHAFEIRDEILRRFKTLLDQADEAARLAGEVERLRAALGEQRHIVDVAETEFGLQHPVECRPDLLGCAVGKALNALDGPPMPVGRYVVEIGPDGLSFAALAPPEPSGDEG